jgi:hypothetical protein
MSDGRRRPFVFQIATTDKKTFMLQVRKSQYS